MVRLRHAVETLERRVGAAVIDKTDAPCNLDRIEDARELAVELFDDRRLVVTRNDDCDVGVSHGSELSRVDRCDLKEVIPIKSREQSKIRARPCRPQHVSR